MNTTAAANIQLRVIETRATPAVSSLTDLTKEFLEQLCDTRGGSLAALQTVE